MKGNLHAFHRSGGELESDFELNIAPIIDCFTVLITYLLISASFFQITMRDIGLSGKGEPQDVVVEKDPIHVHVQMNHGNQVVIKISGKEKESFTVNAVDGHADAKSIAGILMKYKQKYPKVQASVVSAESTTEYVDIVKVIDGVRTAFPLVSIGDE